MPHRDARRTHRRRRSPSSAWPACSRRRPIWRPSGTTSSAAVDAIGEPVPNPGTPNATSRPGRIKTPVRRLPEGPVPLRPARVRHHAELDGRRRARPVPGAARGARRAGSTPATCGPTSTTATPASSSATAPICTAARSR